MCKPLVSFDRILLHVITRRIFVLGGRKPPSAILHVPVHARVGYYLLEAFKAAHDECTMCPGTGIGHLSLRSVGKDGEARNGKADIEMIAVFLWGKLAALLNEVSKLRLTSLEFAGFVIGGNPVGDLVCL
jgi:hypothetical protein